MPLVSKAFGDIITFTRASTGTYFDSAGVLQSAAIDVPRLDYNPSTLAAQGLLIEEARTNSIRNNTMQGAVAGTPGTSPTNWSLAGLSGLTQQIVGTGTESGINYIDVRISGTTTSALFYVIRPESAAFVVATNGQTWTSSHYVRLVGGSLTNLTQINNVIQYSDAVGTPLTYGIGGITPTGAALNTQRFVRTTTASNASTAFVVGYVQLEANSGVAIDITLRVGLPQLEQGAFATSVIPTTTTALTRSADVASVNTLSPWYNSTAGTLFAEYSIAGFAPASAFPASAVLSDNTGNNRININSTNTGANLYGFAEVQTGGALQAGFYGAAGSTFGTGATRKSAIAYAVNDFAFTTQGLAVQTDTSGTVPTVDRLYLGLGPTGTGQWQNGWLRRVTYFPRRLANAELVSITT